MERMTDRKDIERHSTLLVKGSFGKPDLYKVEVGDQIFMVKDVRKRGFLLRWTLGLWLIQKEWKIYSRLKGLKGIPQPVKQIDRFAFAMEFIPGVPIERGKIIPPSFFSDLDQVLKAIHSRGVVHMDLRHKGNILVSDKGEPFLIDFNSSFSFRERGILRRFLFPLFQWVDVGGLLKLKERASPNLMTPGELDFLKRFNRLRKLWIFN